MFHYCRYTRNDAYVETATVTLRITHPSRHLRSQHMLIWRMSYDAYCMLKILTNVWRATERTKWLAFQIWVLSSYNQFQMAYHSLGIALGLRNIRKQTCLSDLWCKLTGLSEYNGNVWIYSTRLIPGPWFASPSHPKPRSEMANTSILPRIISPRRSHEIIPLCIGVLTRLTLWIQVCSTLLDALPDSTTTVLHMVVLQTYGWVHGTTALTIARFVLFFSISVFALLDT